MAARGARKVLLRSGPGGPGRAVDRMRTDAFLRVERRHVVLVLAHHDVALELEAGGQLSAFFVGQRPTTPTRRFCCPRPQGPRRRKRRRGGRGTGGGGGARPPRRASPPEGSNRPRPTCSGWGLRVERRHVVLVLAHHDVALELEAGGQLSAYFVGQRPTTPTRRFCCPRPQGPRRRK